MLRWLQSYVDRLEDRFRPPCSVGERGERLAARFLRDAGYRIIARNWRGRTGELDLIAARGSVVLFVEVKTRHAHSSESAREAITAAKQRQIARVASEWWQRYGRFGNSLRLDVITVVLGQNDDLVELEHIEQAFDSPL